MNHLRFLSKILANLVSGISSFLPLAIGVYFSIQGDLKLSVVMAIYLASDRIISPLLNAMDYYQKNKYNNSNGSTNEQIFGI